MNRWLCRKSTHIAMHCAAIATQGRGAKRKAAPAAAIGDARGAQQEQQQQRGVGYASRDSTLTMFHALGKLLYNKRVGQQEPGGSPEASERDNKRKASLCLCNVFKQTFWCAAA
jgi:hypothetical protein